MKLLYLVAGVVAAVAVLFGVAWTQQRRLLYFPEGDPGPPPQGWAEVTIHTDDGLELVAWHRSASDERVGPTIVVFHGNGGNRTGGVSLGGELAQRGFGVLLVDYRGYGGNPGTPGERGLEQDAEAAARFARSSAQNGPIVYYGESLGAAVATGLAVSAPPDAIVLISPFTSVDDVGRFHYPLAPDWLIRESYPSLERFQSGALEGIPVLVVAGGADSIVPVAQSKMIAEAANAEWHEVPDADHNDRALRSAPQLAQWVADFVARVTG